MFTKTNVKHRIYRGENESVSPQDFYRFDRKEFQELHFLKINLFVVITTIDYSFLLQNN